MISVNVLKKDGRTEAFQIQKIVDCCVAAGISESLARKVAEKVSKKVYPLIPTSVIRKYVYNELKELDKKAAAAYETYEQTKVRGE